jgi:hypothetical protein
VEDIYRFCCPVSTKAPTFIQSSSFGTPTAVANTACEDGTLTIPNSSNFCIIPFVFLFYPETAYRSLEEMDTIFRKTKSIFNTVKVAKKEPRRYGKHGELLINYEHSAEHQRLQELAQQSDRAPSQVGDTEVLQEEYSKTS